MSGWDEYQKARHRRRNDLIRVIYLFVRQTQKGLPIRYNHSNLKEIKTYIFHYNKVLGKEKSSGILYFKLDWVRMDDFEDGDVEILEFLPQYFKSSDPFT